MWRGEQELHPPRHPSFEQTANMNRLAFPLPSCEISSLPVASVAQLAEQLTLNQLVLGSSPSRGTNKAKGFLVIQPKKDLNPSDNYPAMA